MPFICYLYMYIVHALDKELTKNKTIFPATIFNSLLRLFRFLIDLTSYVLHVQDNKIENII